MNSTSSKSELAAGPAVVFEAAGLKKDFDDGKIEALRGADFKIAEG